ncbi:hypothetical protein D8S78_17840 [Natrialba swarupiae]|nr:hypothetical protein [Natrialba swarupiae]
MSALRRAIVKPIVTAAGETHRSTPTGDSPGGVDVECAGEPAIRFGRRDVRRSSDDPRLESEEASTEAKRPVCCMLIDATLPCFNTD